MGLIAGAGLIYFLQNHADSVAGWINHLPALNLDPKQPGIPSMVFGVVLIVVMLLLPTGRRRLVASRIRAANKSGYTLGPRWEWARGSSLCARSSPRLP